MNILKNLGILQLALLGLARSSDACSQQYHSFDNDNGRGMWIEDHGHQLKKTNSGDGWGQSSIPIQKSGDGKWCILIDTLITNKKSFLGIRNMGANGFNVQEAMYLYPQRQQEQTSKPTLLKYNDLYTNLKEQNGWYKYLKLEVDELAGTMTVLQNGELIYNIQSDVLKTGINEFVIALYDTNEQIKVLNPKNYPELSYETFNELQQSQKQVKDQKIKNKDLLNTIDTQKQAIEKKTKTMNDLQSSLKESNESLKKAKENEEKLQSEISKLKHSQESTIQTESMWGGKGHPTIHYETMMGASKVCMEGHGANIADDAQWREHAAKWAKAHHIDVEDGKCGPQWTDLKETFKHGKMTVHVYMH